MSDRNLDEHGRESGPLGSEPASGEGEERATTPFDHPFFLPALLIAFTAWFGYDGWLNKHFDPQWISFNRYGFFVLLPLAAYFTIQSVRDVRRGK